MQGWVWSSTGSLYCDPNEKLYLGLDIFLKRGVLLETVVIHELRHILDYLYGREPEVDRSSLQGEIRAYAAQAIAYEEMTGDMEGFIQGWAPVDALGPWGSVNQISVGITFELLFPNGDREWVQGP